MLTNVVPNSSGSSLIKLSGSNPHLHIGTTVREAQGRGGVQLPGGGYDRGDGIALLMADK